MQFSVFLPTRKRNGRRVVARQFVGRLWLNGETEATRHALGTSDKKAALAKLDTIRHDREQERAGLIAPKAQRDAAQRPLVAFLPEFSQFRVVKGNDEKYVKGDEARLRKIIAGCGWETMADVTLHSFEKWLTAQPLSPKTLNEYLNAARVFFKWMHQRGFAATNPLEKAERMDTRGRETKSFRAYTFEEFSRLVKRSGERGIVYMTGGYSG